MKVAVDTNILIRVIAGDDEEQARLAQAELAAAELIAIPLPSLCELVWVLRRGYGIPAMEIADAIATLLATANVETDRPAVEIGLAQLRAGGDFADGVIAFEGRRLGGDVFLSFDRRAVRLVQAAGGAARVLR